MPAQLSLDKVIVVIPVYRQLTPMECVSLQQCIRVLGGHPIALVTSISLIVEEFLMYYPFRVERFPDKYFESTEGYSWLLLSTEFYARFADYTYMLIYQLDAFVFSDRLQEFCQQGYDYMGAPVPRWGWEWAKKRVGNGGFSLRRVTACQRVLQKFSPQQFFAEYHIPHNLEDCYFGRCSEIEALNFHVPTVREALEFAVDFNLFKCYRWMPDWLPFGCHGWNKVDYWHWRPIIMQYGYELLKPAGEAAEDARKRPLIRYLVKRMLRPSSRKNILQSVVDTMLPIDRPLVLWGWGKYGRLIVPLLRKAGRDITLVYDKTIQSSGEITVTLPDVQFVKCKHGFVLISAIDFEDEISEELVCAGLTADKDYCRISRLLNGLARAYLKTFMKNSVQ